MGTNLISGLASGFDWRSMIDQLIKLEQRPVDLVAKQKGEYEEKLSAWRSFNTDLLSLKTASSALKSPEDFYVYTSQMTTDSSTVKASDLLSVSTSSSAGKGSYELVVNELARAQKLSSTVFNSRDQALGASYEGDLLINGTAVNITATDTLSSVRDKINNANSGDNPSGVTASIITYGTNDFRLVLTSDNTGLDGMSLQNGSAGNLVQAFGWKDKTSELKNSVTGGAQTDLFSSTTREIKDLLGLSTTQSGTIEVAGTEVEIDLSADSLESIKDKINAVDGLSASIVTASVDGATHYRIQVDGTQAFTDDQNILGTLGIFQNGTAGVQGTTSTNSMTTNGDTITSSTLLADIDGYHSWTSGDCIDITGTDHSGNAVSETFTITSSSTVGDLAAAIKAAFEAEGDEVAVYVTSDGKIQVANQETGDSSLDVSLASSVSDGELDWGTFSDLAAVRERELVEGRDATVTIDGVQVTSSDNTIKDVIPGVTLDLKKADTETTVTLNVNRDLDAVMGKINSFVEAYNKVSTFISSQQAYDEETEKTGGVLFGDNTLSSVKSQLTSVLTERVQGVSSEYSTLGLVGISVDKEGMLSVDESKLKGHLETNFNDVMKLFSGHGSTSSGDLEYVSYSRNTQAGDYSVHITQAATRSTAASDTAVFGTLGGDETLNITQDGKTAEISLTSDMTISDIINAINTEMDTVYTEKHVGSDEVTASDSAAAASTAWSAIDGVSLADGDKIGFSGTARNGASVSGSYTISDTDTDTIQGLLSEIESAFGNNVIASIDSSGRMVLTDKKEGNSQVSLSLDYSETQNQEDIFGTVSTGNDGGREGRWAMTVTAANDGSDHLVITHDSYGSNKSFTISETGDLLWTGGDQTVDNGLDVAGTINGEAATGSGRVLRGGAGENNVDGLVIKYTGTSTGEAGTVKLTLGAAELFDRALYNITDPYDGYVSFKQDSLEDTIERLDTRREDMMARIDRKMEMMINRFVAMERAIQQIQSQSQWLSGQLNSLYAQWE
ncbi:MAG: flagellar filament capping protein FliD [Desulfatiglandales bacterium]